MNDFFESDFLRISTGSGGPRGFGDRGFGDRGQDGRGGQDGTHLYSDSIGAAGRHVRRYCAVRGETMVGHIPPGVEYFWMDHIIGHPRNSPRFRLKKNG